MKAYPLYTDTRAPVEVAAILDVKTPVSHCETCKIPHPRMMPADLVMEHCSVKDPTGGILVVGDMPSESEFRAFRPFSMGPKATLRRKIEENTDLPIVYDNAIKCPPVMRRGKRVAPKDKQMEQHRGYLAALIKEMKPSRILCFGKEAYWSVLGSTTPPGSCRRGHGFLSDHTPVFMLPPARDFHANRFLLKRAIDDIQWALAEKPRLPPWKGTVKVVETEEDALQAISEMRMAPWTTIDTETSGQQHEPEFFLITCLAAVPAGSDDAWVWDQAGLTNPALVQPLKDYLCDAKCLKAGHNYKYDIEMMAFYLKLIDPDTGEILIKGVYGDSQLWAKQLDTEALCRLEYAADIIGMGGHKAENKEALVGARTKIKEGRDRAANSDYYQNPLPGMFSPIVQAAVDRPELDEDTFAYGLVPYTTMIRYCALDTVASDRLISHLGPKIRADPNMRFVWETFLAPATDALAQIEAWGMPCSRRKLKAFIKLMKGKVAHYLKQLRKLGCDIDLASGPALQEFLYDKLGLKVLKLTNSGERSTDKETLKKLLDLTKNPVLDALLKYREVETLYTRYGVGMLPLIRSTGRIHGTFKLDGTRSGRLSSSDPNCFDGETEILTETGWQKFACLDPKARVFQVDQNEMTTSLVHPEGHISKWSDDVVHIRTRAISLMVTGDHECLVETRAGRRFKAPAANYPEDHKQHHCVDYDFKGGDLRLSHDEVVVLCALQADGHITPSGAVDWGFTKGRKVVRLTKALDSLGVPHSGGKGSRGRTRVYVKREDIAKFTDLLGPRKSWGEFVLRFDRRTARDVVEEIYHWDGCITRLNHYSSSDKTDCDWIQILQTLCSEKSRMREYRPANPGSRVNYQLDVVRKGYSWTTNRSIKKTKAQQVYCVKVPHGNIIVRRDNCVMVTGQCQNIPSGGEFAKMIKGVFQPQYGYSLISLDYSQLEYRIIAALANDKVMQQAYYDGEDLHMRTAKTICRMAWNIEPEEVTADHRRMAKTFSFGLLYGMTDGTLAKQLNISKAAATKIRAALMANWQAVDEWIKQRKIFSARNGCTYTYWPDGKGGWREARRRDLPDMGSDYDGFRITATNGSYNTAVQGTASDYMLMTLSRVVPWLIGSEIPGMVVNTVHDSIILEVRDDYVDEVIEFVKAIMEGWSANGIPLVADPEVGVHWGKLLDYNKVKLAKRLLKDDYLPEEAVKVLGLKVKEGQTPQTVIEPYFEMAARLAA